MSRINSANKKRALTLRKEKLIEELKYYERRLEEAKINQTKQIEYEESSDSDTEMPTLKIEPSITNLKIEHSALQTCFDATQELTGLQVLQSEVNVLVEDPNYDGEPPVTEEGMWREVTVECRVDLVPFSMSFYVHQPSKRFGGLSYRGLKVTVLKKPHEAELNKSLLHELRRPSEAFEVLKAYSSAHRSRRTTLAQLATSHSSTLRMAPLADGGYQLKCGNLLEISWSLQNKSSPVAPFHHRMKFDLEYMDEVHIQTVMAAHKALSDPTIDTDERTSLLSKIITVCLEVQGINPLESTSESEAAPSKSELPTKRKRDEEAMAPPKAPPKKSRPKGKENKDENRLGNARDNMDHGGSEMGGRSEANTGGRTVAKTCAVSDHTVKDNAHNAKKLGEKDKRSKSAEGTVKNRGGEVIKEVVESNRKDSAKNSAKVSVSEQILVKSKDKGLNNVKKVTEVNDRKKSETAAENGAKNNGDKVTKEVSECVKKVTNSETKVKAKDDIRTKVVGDVIDKRHNRVIEDNNGVKDHDVQNVKKAKLKDKRGPNEIVASKDTEVVKAASSNTIPKINKNQDVKKSTLHKQDAKNNQGVLIKKNIEQNIEKTANQPNLPNNKQSKKKHTDKTKPISHTQDEITKKTALVDKHKNIDTNNHNLDKNSLEPTKTLKKTIDSIPSEVKTKLLKNQFSRRSITNNVMLKKNTRIPQKAPSSIQKIMKKNPLWISPRKSISKVKGLPPKIRKPLTHIPRLVAKSVVK